MIDEYSMLKGLNLDLIDETCRKLSDNIDS